MQAKGCYFDGKSSRRHEVFFSIEDRMLVMTGDAERRCPLKDLAIAERGQTAHRKIRFSDGAFAEVEDGAAFTQMLATVGYKETFVERMQQSWRAAGAAVAATMAILIVGYLWGLPAASDAIARHLPPEADRAIGGKALEMMDQRMLAPSQLGEARRQALAARFAMLRPPKEDAPSYELVFRKSRIGPNAFALPSGQIVLTDEIVQLVDDDDAVMGILAHELGHLHARHLMRRLIQGSALSVAGMALLGDVSSVVANLPMLMLDMKYSRDAEREADDYAVAMLKANHLDPGKMAMVFEKLEKKSGNSPLPYFSSHPLSKERIARIRGS